MPYELITRLLGVPDFCLVDIETDERSVVLTLERKEMTFRCGSCGKAGLPGYDHGLQEVCHLLWWQHPTETSSSLALSSIDTGRPGCREPRSLNHQGGKFRFPKRGEFLLPLTRLTDDVFRPHDLENLGDFLVIVRHGTGKSVIQTGKEEALNSSPDTAELVHHRSSSFG